MKRYRSCQKGFTLVEVLVASAIGIASMGLLLSLFAGSLDRMSRVE
ncbi:MAG: type II secretion system protein, partial [Gammaproteobacteria bacterium]|nr:type II secretion system protein [Gammaproteobacteria bacterium]MBT5790575.1 type II secretion system protein [Gammaproteobacteria bacterium]